MKYLILLIALSALTLAAEEKNPPNIHEAIDAI